MMRIGTVWFLVGAFLSLLPGPSRAAVQANITVELETKLWLLNGDSARQPQVPLQQAIDTPVIRLTGTAEVSPSPEAATRIQLPARFGGVQTITATRTTMGAKILQANPTDRFDPFTAKIRAVNENEAGGASRIGGPGGGWGGELVINVDTTVVLDQEVTFEEVFVARIPLLDTFGSRATTTFRGLVAVLEIPIDGTARGEPFTTRAVSTTARLITARLGNDVNGTPTGFQTLTFNTEGSFAPNRVAAVTPFVVDSFAGTGPQRIPIPFRGFLRATVTGVTFVPEPRALGLAAVAGLLGVAAWLRAPASRRAGARSDPGEGHSRGVERLSDLRE